MLGDSTHTLGRHRRLTDSDDSDDEGGKQSRVLTAARASELCPKPFRLIANNGGFTTIDDLSDLKQLDYIDLCGNQLKSLSGLEENKRLKTLKLTSNRLSDLNPILRHDSIKVLNISENPLRSLEWLRYAAFAQNLVLLVVTGNRLVSLDGVLSLSSVRTLVLSNNELDDVEPLMRLPSLEKLSLSHNHIRALPQSLSKLTRLHELRVAHNRLTTLPSAEILGKLKNLHILDVGHNKLNKLDLLSSASQLVNVNVRGNPVCEEMQDIPKAVRALCPGIEIIDGVRVAGGRRKLRINRLRAATGFSAEDDRKFVRAPPVPVIRKIVEGDASTVLDEDAKEEARRVLKRAQKKEGSGEEIPKDKDVQNESKEEKSDVPKSNGEIDANSNASKVARTSEENGGEAIENGIEKASPGKKRSRERESSENEGIEVKKGGNDDEEIGAESFLQQARQRHMSKTTGRVKVREMSQNKKRKKDRKGRRKESSDADVANLNQSFGFGGDSQW